MNGKRRVRFELVASIMTICLSWIGCADTAAPPEMMLPEGMYETDIPDEALREIMSDERFVEAMAIVAEDGMELDEERAFLALGREQPEEFEAVFPVMPGEADYRGEDAYVVYQQSGASGTVFFVPSSAVNAASDHLVESSQALLMGCASWSPWKDTTGWYCAHRSSCRRDDKQGTFVNQSRFKNCKNGYKVQERRKFVDCGC